jgi:DNA-directed RNA polymerase II subunit RPB1
LKELIDLSTKIRTPSLRLVMQEPYSTHENMARMLAAGVEHTVLHQVVATSEVVWCPPDAPLEGPDAPMVRMHEALDESWGQTEGANNSVIRFVLDRTLMACKQLSVEAVGAALAAYMGDQASVIWSEVNMLSWVVRMRLRGLEVMVDAASTPPEEARDLEMKACRTVHDYLLDNVPVHGVGGITRVVVRCNMVSLPDASTGALLSAPRWSADTEGTNLDKVLALQGVDATRTRSNDIYETLAVLGVEAATHQLLTEIRTVLSHDGAYVNDRHLQLLADVMTHTGGLAPVTRHSMMKLGASVYTRASFEQTQDVLTWAASMGVGNATHGVTESIMLGTQIDGGTGACEIISPAYAQPPPPPNAGGVKPLMRPTNRGTARVAPLKRPPAIHAKPVRPLARPAAPALGAATRDGFVGKKRKTREAGGKQDKKQRVLVLNSPIFRKPNRTFTPHSPTSLL